MEHLHFCAAHLGDFRKQMISEKTCMLALDVLMTIFKRHIIAAACSELGMSDIDGVLSLSAELKMGKEEKNRLLIVDLACKIVENCTVVSHTFLNEAVKECEDGAHNYTHNVPPCLTCYGVHRCMG